jgi:PAS domain S-box-containing protein
MSDQAPSVDVLQEEVVALRHRITELEQTLALQQASFDQTMADRTAALRRTEQVLREVIDNIPAVISAKDRDGRYLFANRLYAGLLEQTPDQMRGLTDYDLRPDEADAWRADDEKIVQSGQAITVEEQGHLPDGIHTYRSSKFPIYDLDGELLGTGGIATDITELKQAERDIHNFKTLVERAPDGIMLVDSEQNILWHSFARCAGTTCCSACRICRLRVDEVGGHLLHSQ